MTFSLVDIAAGLGGLLVGAVVGFLLGSATRGRRVWRFWVLAAAILLVGIAIASYGELAAMQAAWIAALAFLAAGFTGLKYGAGRVPGVGAAPRAQAEDVPRRPTAGGFVDRSSREDADTEIRRH